MSAMDYLEKLKETKRLRQRAQTLKNKGFGPTEIARRLGLKSRQSASYYLKDAEQFRNDL